MVFKFVGPAWEAYKNFIEQEKLHFVATGGIQVQVHPMASIPANLPVHERNLNFKFGPMSKFKSLLSYLCNMNVNVQVARLARERNLRLAQICNVHLYVTYPDLSFTC